MMGSQGLVTVASLVLIGLITVNLSLGLETTSVGKRKGRLFPVFQIVTFPNDACSSNSGRNGTCYTAEECSSRSGAASGSCAMSIGVCCVFTRTCGGSSSENCTYFDYDGTTSGACTLQVCKCSSNVCQLRLDFDQFVISGPSTSTVTIGNLINGQLSNTGTASLVTQASQCLTDTFTVSNPGGRAPPTICGTNTVYVDAHDACNDLTFQLGQAGVGTQLAQRAFSIKITQYDCTFPNLAPDGCTQYFFGMNTDTVQTFNFQGGMHLANQDQNICVRRERGNCRICWTATMDTDFQVSNPAATGIVPNASKRCCAYIAAAAKTSGVDCAVIPGAMTVMNNAQGLDQICGRSQGLLTAGATASSTVCSDRTPFNIRFLTDEFEFSNEITADMNAGFQLSYIQTSNNC